MPMDFPDMASLRWAATVHKFREPLDGEAEDAYRVALADHVKPMDRIESLEIRNKVGWDKFKARQNEEMVFGTRVTRAAHMAWCKERALHYADAGKVVDCIASMVSDLQKHPETFRMPMAQNVSAYKLMLEPQTPETLRAWVNSFPD